MRAPTLLRYFFSSLQITLTASGLMMSTAWADQTLTFDGPVPEGGPDHFFVPFYVPAGTREIEIRHDDRSDDNILDFGVHDPAGYRGWGGGTTEPAILGEQAASRAYVPGPLPIGTWQVVVGKAKVVASPAVYHIEVVLRDRPTLAPQAERRPYRASAPLARGRRYYAGDLHVHSRESTDAGPPLSQIVAFARRRGLDFVEISDHNTVTQLDYFAAAQPADLLLVPGIEYTTYAGHANAIGATGFVEHKLGQTVAGRPYTIADAAATIAAQGALLSINHPVLDLGLSCIGCAWRQPLSPSAIQAVEVGSGGLRQGAFLFTAAALRFWEALLAQGVHVAAVGGSDDHQGGTGTGRMDSPIGDPTTMVLADELSVPALVDAIRHGRTVVKLQGPSDPMVELTASQPGGTSADATVGDTLAVRSTRLSARVTGIGADPTNQGMPYLRWIKNGESVAETAITSDPFVSTLPVLAHHPENGAPASPEDRYRVEIHVDGMARTITSPLYVRYDEGGPDVLAGEVPDNLSGCRASPRPPQPRSLVASLAALAAWALRRSLRRRA